MTRHLHDDGPPFTDGPPSFAAQLEAYDRAPHPADEPTSTPTHADRAVPGGDFLLDRPTEVPAVWGDGPAVAWPQGEPFYLAGGIGTGKTTLGGQVALRRVGIGTGPVLGLPVADDGGRLLYLAMDRPAQIARALGRMVDPADRDTLNRRMTFWKGPLPFHLPDHPSDLAQLAADHKATTVVIDSVKDLAGGIEKPEVGWAVNAAMQECVTAGIEVGAWHHQRKASGDNKKPTTLADLYGSAWLGAGAGSVVLLWGGAGDPVVELTHLKPAMDQLGPWQVLHDHDAGTSSLMDAPDPLAILNRAIKGITARTMAQALTDKPDPSTAEVERARRQLDRLHRSGHAEKVDGDPASHTPAMYQPCGGGS